MDLLAFGPHPDDIEIGMGATIALYARRGWSVGLVDLTRGELGSNGTPEQRMAEGEAARAALGAVVRENLALPDGGLDATDPHQVRAIVDCVRRHRPRVVAIPYWSDRHPDHEAAARLLRQGIFRAGLRRAETDAPAWRPGWVCHYFINDAATPSFVVDVTEVYDTKRKALDCHRSQFYAAGDGATATRLTSPLFRQLIESRDAQFGALAGVRWAEGFVVREPVLRSHLFREADPEPRARP
ncbi:MAG TPA: bacillithiol biosynthesis deacetylase BshB1 [Vicinamibacterales bacterium]